MQMRRCPGCMSLTDRLQCPVCGWREGQGNKPQQLQPGTVLQGRYVIGKALGQGGFGITYLSWDLRLEQQVAVKEFFPSSLVTRNTQHSTTVQLFDDTAGDCYEASLARFLREAKALAVFSDVPEIVTIYGCFEENHTAYIVMEYVKGSNLAQYGKLRGGTLGVEEILQILKPVMAALDTVHKAGFVHRDISPDNIILDPTGGAKLLDFGAVRAVENPAADKDLTHSTEAILKHGFAPMEQYRSRGGIGPWTDEYALCATIWYCLTGKLPPEAPSRATGEPGPDWSSIPGLEPHQRAALEKGMSMAPGDRYPSVGALSEALFSPRPKPVPAGKWIAAAAVGIAVLLALVLIVPRLLTDHPAPTEASEPTEASAPTETAAPTESSGLTESPGPETTEPEATAPEATAPVRQTFVMMPSADFSEIDTDRLEYQPIWGQHTYLRRDVRTIRFHSSTEGAASNAWDVSAGKNGTVLAWLDGSVLHVAADGNIAANPDGSWMFAYFTNLETVDFGDCFDTSQVTTMHGMFLGCYNLSVLDLSGFQTSSVTKMRGMFQYCESLTALNLNGLQTGSVTDMREMFRDCKLLQTLDVSGFDTARVTNMYAMFSTCTALVKLDLGSFDTSRVTNMGYMFSACRSLEEVNVSGFDTSNVINMEGMFRWCGVLREPDLSGWDVSRVSTFSGFMDDGMTINGRPWKEFFR